MLLHFASILFFFCRSAAAYPDLSADLGSITGWLTEQAAEGLAFNGGVNFSPPSEPRPYRFEFDAGLGIGSIPLDGSKFPHLSVAQLDQVNVKSVFPASVPFPNATAHLRMGLPGRLDMAVRFSDMTVPKYRLSPNTTANGQSNIFGGEIRRRFLGGDGPVLLTASLMVNYLRGRFNFYNTIPNIQLADDFSISASNTGLLRWSLINYGFNAVGSYQSAKPWIPFLGAGFSRSAGSVLAKMGSVFSSDLVQPSLNESSSAPRKDTMRVIVGTEYLWSRISLYVSGEILAVGHAEGETYNVHAGFVLPLSWGRGYAGREARRTAVRKAAQVADSGFIFIQ